MSNPLFDALFAPHAWQDTPFLHLPGGQTQTHQDFLAKTAQLANSLASAGLLPGDRLAAQTAKSAETLMLYAACVQTGVVFLPLNTAYTTAELDYFLRDSGARMIVCDPAQEQALTPLAQELSAHLRTLDANGSGTLTADLSAHDSTFDTASRTQDDLAALLYTSGTTGRSKGAMLSHRNLLSNARALTDLWRFTSDDVLLHALPIFHTHGLFVATNISLLAGGAMLFHPRFDIDQMIADLPRATAMMGVPTFYTRLLDDPRLTPALCDTMRVFISGSAPLLFETHVRFEKRTGHRILERYGMTETNMSTSNPYEGDRRAGTVGFPLPGVSLRIVGSDGTPVADGEVGGIEVKGDNVFLGYWNMPEKTAEEFTDDGYFISGDLAQRDEDGYISIVGRAKDLIISGGYNIYPKEVEDELDTLPGVLESAVIGIPDADMGEAVHAVIVPDGSVKVDTESLRIAIRDRLARFKQPRSYSFVDALPRNSMGKVQKATLRQLNREKPEKA